MISAFGALDDVFTWLTLALPTQTEQRKLLLISLAIKIVGIQSSFFREKNMLSYFLTHTLNKLTCLRGLCCVRLWCLIQGKEPTLRCVFKVFSSKIELQLSILLDRGDKQLAQTW